MSPGWVDYGPRGASPWSAREGVWASSRKCSRRSKAKWKSLHYPVFLEGLPSKYPPGPTLHSSQHKRRFGLFSIVCPQKLPAADGRLWRLVLPSQSQCVPPSTMKLPSSVPAFLTACLPLPSSEGRALGRWRAAQQAPGIPECRKPWRSLIPVLLQAAPARSHANLPLHPTGHRTARHGTLQHLCTPHHTTPYHTTPHHTPPNHTKAQHTTPCHAAPCEMRGSEQQHPPGQALGAPWILSASSLPSGSPPPGHSLPSAPIGSNTIHSPQHPQTTSPATACCLSWAL